MPKRPKQHLAPKRSREGAAKGAAVATDYFFLLRASECVVLAGDQNGYVGSKGPRGADVTPRRPGEPCGSMAEAGEVVVKTRGNTMDQLDRREWRNHFCVRPGADGARPTVCVAEALELYERWAPERFKGDKVRDPSS